LLDVKKVFFVFVHSLHKRIYFRELTQKTFLTSRKYSLTSEQTLKIFPWCHQKGNIFLDVKKVFCAESDESRWFIFCSKSKNWSFFFLFVAFFSEKHTKILDVKEIFCMHACERNWKEIFCVRRAETDESEWFIYKKYEISYYSLNL